MSFRYMRLMVFYDLPTFTAIERKRGALFRKNLLKEGFVMLQESVYTKLVLNESVLELVKNRVKKMLPEEGSVMAIAVTEKQFERMEIYIGDNINNNVLSTDRMIVL